MGRVNDLLDATRPYTLPSGRSKPAAAASVARHGLRRRSPPTGRSGAGALVLAALVGAASRRGHVRRRRLGRRRDASRRWCGDPPARRGRSSRSRFGWLPVPRDRRSGPLLAPGAGRSSSRGPVRRVWWSIVADRSWDAFNKSVAYAAFLGLGIVLAAVGRGRAARLGGLDALARHRRRARLGAAGQGPARARSRRRPRRAPPRAGRLLERPRPARRHRARSRALARHRRPRTARACASRAAFSSTSRPSRSCSRSRGRASSSGVGVLALWLVLASERVQGGLLLLASAVPRSLVGSWAFTRPALTEDVATRSDRVADGAVFGVLALVGARVVAGLVASGYDEVADGDEQPAGVARASWSWPSSGSSPRAPSLSVAAGRRRDLGS